MTREKCHCWAPAKYGHDDVACPEYRAEPKPAEPEPDLHGEIAAFLERTADCE